MPRAIRAPSAVFLMLGLLRPQSKRYLPVIRHLETFPHVHLGIIWKRFQMGASGQTGALSGRHDDRRKPLDSPNMPRFLWSGIWKRFHMFT